LTDGKGRVVNFRNAVIIMTSNVGSSAIVDLGATDPAKARAEAMDALRATFRPEFLNRVDEIVFFNPLGSEQLGKIVDMQVAQAAKQLESRQITIELSPEAREVVFREGFDPAYGARPLRRAIQRLVQDPLAMQILEGRILPGAHVRVDKDKKTGGLRFTAVDKAAAAASK